MSNITVFIRVLQVSHKYNMEQSIQNKTGPKPKGIVTGTIHGKAVGRDKTVVPPDQVYELASIGCTDMEISNFFGINQDTLRYNFAEELVKGREYVKIRLRQAMMKNATQSMNAAVQIFLAKNILGMSDQGANTEATAPLPWDTETGDKDDREDNWSHNEAKEDTDEV